jgi:ribosomal protein S18 acetylase RimI-like enzyme
LSKGIDVTLDAFCPQDYQQLIDWINSPELNYLWGGPAYDFPLTIQQIEHHLSNSQVSAYLCRDESKVIGYIELFETRPDAARVCRVFVSPKFRGQGAAKSMIEQLETISMTRGYQTLDLCVFSHNDSAIRCYQQLGFEEIKRELGTRSFEGENWELLYMRKSLDATQSQSSNN